MVAAVILTAFVLASAGLVLGAHARLLSSETLLRKSFSHFPHDEVNAYSASKLDRLGQEAEILDVHHDQTVTCEFDDGVRHDMPIEAFSVSAQNSSRSGPELERGHIGRVGPSTQGAVEVPPHPLPKGANTNACT